MKIKMEGVRTLKMIGGVGGISKARSLTLLIPCIESLVGIDCDPVKIMMLSICLAIPRLGRIVEMGSKKNI